MSKIKTTFVAEAGPTFERKKSPCQECPGLGHIICVGKQFFEKRSDPSFKWL